MFPWAKSIPELLLQVLNTSVGRAASDLADMLGKAGRAFQLARGTRLAWWPLIQVSSAEQRGR